MHISYNKLWKMLIDKNMKKVIFVIRLALARPLLLSLEGAIISLRMF